ncbi:MAG: DUF937 domain-containing protein [Lysobacteraceae bacterium]
MNALLQQVMGSIDGSVVQQVSNRFGIPPDQALSAINSALPAILGAIGQQTSTPGGADAIHTAAQQVSGMLGSGGVQGMLGQIFGGQQNSAVQSIGAATGLPQEHAQHMLSVLGPLVLAAIGNHAAQTGTGAQGLGQILGDAVQHAQAPGGLGGIGGMLGSLFGKS